MSARLPCAKRLNGHWFLLCRRVDSSKALSISENRKEFLTAASYCLSKRVIGCICRSCRRARRRDRRARSALPSRTCRERTPIARSNWLSSSDRALDRAPPAPSRIAGASTFRRQAPQGDAYASYVALNRCLATACQMDSTHLDTSPPRLWFLSRHARSR
jgi:hypothetical protein